MAYQLDVYTGDRTYAGTDANIVVSLSGDRGATPEVTINPLVSGNAFERGDHDVIQLPVEDVGDIEQISIRHDNAWAGAGWFLDKVGVTRRATGVYSEFPCYRWLATDEDDGAISRILTVTGGPWQAVLAWADTKQIPVGEDSFIINNWNGSNPVKRQTEWVQEYTDGVSTEEGSSTKFGVELASSIGGELEGIKLSASAKTSFERTLTNKYGKSHSEKKTYKLTDNFTADAQELLLVIRQWVQIIEYGTIKRNNIFVNYVARRDLISNLETVSNYQGDSMKAKYKSYLEKHGIDTSEVRWR